MTKKRARGAGFFDAEITRLYFSGSPRRTDLTRRDFGLLRKRKSVGRDEQLKKFLQKLEDMQHQQQLDSLTGGLYQIEESEDEDDEERVESALIDPRTKEVRELLTEFPDLQTFKNGELEVRLKQYAQNYNLPTGIASSCVDLVETNMMGMYAQSKWKWDREKKTRQLLAENSRILVAHDSDDGTPVGFAMFRFLIHADAPVLYLFELQIDQNRAGHRGLGKHFMKLIEKLAAFHKMDWVMLTCFKCNKIARSFYSSLEYEVDETSPGPDENKTHLILSKKLF